MATHAQPGKAPIWPAILFLLWNLMGIAAFTMQSTMNLAELAKTDPVQARIWAAMPTWAWICYGVGVTAGTLSAIALLLRHKVAIWLQMVAIVTIIGQFSYTFLGTDLLSLKGYGTTIFPLVIFVLAIIQFVYARSMGAKGLLR